MSLARPVQPHRRHMLHTKMKDSPGVHGVHGARVRRRIEHDSRDSTLLLPPQEKLSSLHAARLLEMLQSLGKLRRQDKGLWSLSWESFRPNPSVTLRRKCGRSQRILHSFSSSKLNAMKTDATSAVPMFKRHESKASLMQRH